MNVRVMALIEQIVSGCQSGADRAALDFSIEHGISHGGWCPHGRKAEDGTPARYQLKETPSSDYVQRTEWNVRNSDGTVILTIAPILKTGSKKTFQLAQRLNKPVLHIWRDGGPASPARALLRFIQDHQIKVLNVAGPRASKEQDVYEFVKQVLQEALDADAGSSVVYRMARDFEVEEASELARRVFEEFVAAQQSAEGCEEAYRYASAAAFRDRHGAGCVSFAAERQGRIVGVLHLRNGSHISMLFVEGGGQRQGIGSGLVLAAEQYALSRQPPAEALTVASTPNALDAYRKMGFVSVGNEQVKKGLRFVPMQRKIGVAPEPRE
jgi:GNAT superfamily N-acetyltransferase